MNKKILARLHPLEFQHPFDMKAIKALKNKTGLEAFITQFNKHGIERVLRIQRTGSNLRINQKTLPEIYGFLADICKILDLNKIPELYIEWQYSVNASVIGVENPIMVLQSGSIDLLSQEELQFIIGHEVGHIKCNHILYHQIAEVVPLLAGIAGNLTLGLGGLLATGIEFALLNWHRMSEFSADRAGLLACQDINVAIKVLSKMAGIPSKYFNSLDTKEFLEQARHFESFDYDTLDKVAKVVSVMGRSHPWTVMRAAELLRWVDSGEYEKVLSRNKGFFCNGCHASLEGTELFCLYCGEKIENV